MQITSDISYFPGLEAILAVDSSISFDDNDLLPVSIGGKIDIAPWGTDNNLPAALLEKIQKSDVMSSNLQFSTNVCYGLGPRIVRVERHPQTGEIVNRMELLSGREYDFFQGNDIDMFVLQTLTDMNYFHNSFAELIPDENFKEIVSLRCKEAVFSRWGIDSKTKEIISHCYSSKWDKNPQEDDVVSSVVLDEFNAVQDVKRLMALRKKSKARWIFPVYMPSPGKPYYSRPSWYSLFSSGWFDLSLAVAETKKAIIKNQLGVKNIIYVSPRYFENRAKDEGIDMNDIIAMKELRNKEVKAMNDFLSGEGSFSKSMIAFKETFPAAGGGIKEEKYITIEPVNNKFEGGEYIQDTETAANIICYAMGVHPSLIGATPGKNSGSLGGTDKRELYMIKQSLSRSLVNRSMRVFQLIKTINKWDKDIYIELPEYVFTTLDQNKSGKAEKTQTKV